MCNKAIWLNHGKIVTQGDIEEVCHEYETTIEEMKAKEKAERAKKEKELNKQAEIIKQKRNQSVEKKQ